MVNKKGMIFVLYIGILIGFIGIFIIFSDNILLILESFHNFTNSLEVLIIIIIRIIILSLISYVMFYKMLKPE